METLAQSFSTMAPTTTPAATIPLVCARLPATAHAAGQSLYVSPTLSALGITNKTIGSPTQIQMSLAF
jgi:hypothetical protein